MRGKRGKILKNFPSLPPRPHLSFQNFLIFKGKVQEGEEKKRKGEGKKGRKMGRESVALRHFLVEARRRVFIHSSARRSLRPVFPRHSV